MSERQRETDRSVRARQLALSAMSGRTPVRNWSALTTGPQGRPDISPYPGVNASFFEADVQTSTAASPARVTATNQLEPAQSTQSRPLSKTRAAIHLLTLPHKVCTASSSNRSGEGRKLYHRSNAPFNEPVSIVGHRIQLSANVHNVNSDSIGTVALRIFVVGDATFPAIP